ncbi:TonB family protein [Burkholderia cenocepacia]|uniref:TonB family protein n=1 Tax=Burkholderia cenocepacia TaxID=95486 RepID=UPI000F597CE0|nr:TonB family protein [Burkholderia cenocepacia]RQU69090.1 TonB family protein [Burkholderia cenocepacia]
MRRATNSRWFFAARRIRSRNAARRAIADEARPGRRQGKHGTALVEPETDAAGRSPRVSLPPGSGYPRLDAATRDAVLASRCAAQVENGTPTPMRAPVPITFNLDE